MIRAAAYFTLVFGVGFVLGTVRTFWLLPRLGERWAELIEAPFMLIAIVLSARLVTQRFRAKRGVDYLLSGCVALLLLLITEFSVVLGLRELSIREYIAARDPVAGMAYVFMLLIFAIMPWLVGRRQSAR